MKTVMRLPLAAIITMLVLPCAWGGNAHSNTTPTMEISAAATPKPVSALTSQKMKTLAAYEVHWAAVDMQMAPLKTRTQVIEYLTRHKQNSPFDALPAMQRQVFIDSIQYSQSGKIVGFRYDVLDSLTATDAYKILQLFGMQQRVSELHVKSLTPLDKLIMSTKVSPSLKPPWIKGDWCHPAHTCSKASGYACNTSTC